MTLRIKRSKEIDNRRIMFQIESLTRTTQQNEREEEEGDTKKEISEITALLTINQHNAEEERIKSIDKDVQKWRNERKAATECGLMDYDLI